MLLVYPTVYENDYTIATCTIRIIFYKQGTLWHLSNFLATLLCYYKEKINTQFTAKSQYLHLFVKMLTTNFHDFLTCNKDHTPRLMNIVIR